MKIKTIFFDVDGTLLDFKKAEDMAVEKLRVYMEDTSTPEEFSNAYHEVNDRIWIELEQGLITGEELKLERFRRFAAAKNHPASPEDLAEYYMTALGEGAYPLEGSQELLEGLRGEYRLAIITNGLVKVQEARLEAMKYGEIFEEMVISEKEGVSKPRKEIFERCAERMGISLDNSVLMVGDSLSSDIGGGINAGIRTCWYNPGGWKNESPHRPDYEIRHLEELPDLIQTF
ncbi:MAG: YjjG family noncanonical pyrimidine nucleotidase [Spirochaetales bacterium]|nr:YjjG family noncanonical pyrimidine nucleotidase [Spirochaetales bacterium]